MGDDDPGAPGENASASSLGVGVRSEPTRLPFPLHGRRAAGWGFAGRALMLAGGVLMAGLPGAGAPCGAPPPVPRRVILRGTWLGRIGARPTERIELSADLVGLGGAKLGVEGRASCQWRRAWPGSPVDWSAAAETVVGAACSYVSPVWHGQAERGRVLGAGIAGLAGGEQRFAQAVQRLGLDRPGRRHLAVARPGPRWRLRRLAGSGPAAGSACPSAGVSAASPAVAELAEQVQSLPEVAGGLLVPALPHG